MPCKSCIERAKKLKTTVQDVMNKLSPKEGFKHYMMQQADKYREEWPDNPYQKFINNIKEDEK